jgi:hypothetical protein
LCLRVVEWNFRNKGIESYYTRLFQPSVVAIQEGLSPEVRRLRELEALAYETRPQEFAWAEKLCYAAVSLEEVDPATVRALRPSIEYDEPEWVRRVEAEWEGGWIVESVAYWAGVPLQATLAIMLNLRDRMPPGEDWHRGPVVLRARGRSNQNESGT